MKTGQSKLFRKLALNRRSNRINHTVYGGVPTDEIEPIKDYFKARTIPKTVSGPDSEGYYHVKCGSFHGSSGPFPWMNINTNALKEVLGS
uniref:Uncharacterized protein n=1 Tax=Pseudomonas phage RVTF4 TaxID=3236931 RepID=A0AB39CDC6_9VIRU